MSFYNPSSSVVIGNEGQINDTRETVSSTRMIHTCMQTSLESPCIRIYLNPFERAYLKPKMAPRYSATLLVAIPTPSRSRNTYQNSRIHLNIRSFFTLEIKSNKNISFNIIKFWGKLYLNFNLFRSDFAKQRGRNGHTDEHTHSQDIAVVYCKLRENKAQKVGQSKRYSIQN